MPVSDQFVSDVDLDTEEDEQLIARKISSEIQQSQSYWQEFKDLCTELYFDFLAHKEAIDDKSKSNSFIPLPYVDIRVNKGKIKRILTSTKPICRVKPVPYIPELSLKLSLFGQACLDEAGFERFLDILIQDALIYTGAPFQATWGMETRNLPAFDIYQLEGLPPVRLPRIDEMSGKRIFEEQKIREGLFLENIHIQDFCLPKNAKEAEKDPWAGKLFSADIVELEKTYNPNGSPKYFNLERLRELGSTQRQDSGEKTRALEPLKRDKPGQITYVETFDIIEFVTENWIFYLPEGADFIIGREPNDSRRKPFHVARVELLNGEPFGISPNRVNHLMTRTLNEIVDVVMDGLYLEDNKAWVINEELVDDFEVGASQGNLIHVKGLDANIDVQTAIRAIETRAVANEIIPVWDKIDQIHQLVASRPNFAAGVPVQGAETAYENARLEEGATGPVLDMASNLVETALKPIYEDLFHLAKANFTMKKSMEILGDNGELINTITVMPQDLYGDVQFSFEFLGRERKRMEEQAATINLLQVWGNMVNIDPVSVLLMKNLLINSGLSDSLAIQKALDQSIQQRQLIQAIQLAMQGRAIEVGAQAKQAASQKQGKKAGDKQGPVHQTSVRTANATNSLKPAGS